MPGFVGLLCLRERWFKNQNNISSYFSLSSQVDTFQKALMVRHTHLIFDLGGTLISDPFEGVLKKLSDLPYREMLETAIADGNIDDFLSAWKYENRNHDFPFASHFMQEEFWISRAAWPFYKAGQITSKRLFPVWIANILSTYRAIALEAIEEQTHLPELRTALDTATAKGYTLSVASNDRYFATSAMLSAANILSKFRFTVTSEELSFTVSGAEKPSPVFFETLLSVMGINEHNTTVFYLGDDEERDIRGVENTPIIGVRFLGNSSASCNWLDLTARTQAPIRFSNYRELNEMILSGVFDTRKPLS